MKQTIFLCLLALVPAILSATINDAEVNTNNVRVYLYTVAGNQANRVELKANDASTFAGINPAVSLPVLIHGFQQTSACSFPQDIKDAFLNNGYPAAIVVDYRDIAAYGKTGLIAITLYPLAVSALQSVANVVSQILQAVINADKTSLDKIHVIGISLGAHLAGLVANDMNTETDKVARVTGLDPAGPLFDDLFFSLRLQSGDAQFVDVIHTNAGGLGTTKRCGDVDFWPNGGTSQPWCNVGSTDDKSLCSHGSSGRFFLDSIYGTEYLATSCGSYSTFQAQGCANNPQSFIGLMSNSNAMGNYYATTSEPVNWTGLYNCVD